jgi:DNA-binding NarL/FixJ family response regulator
MEIKKAILIVDDSVLITERLLGMLNVFKKEAAIKSAGTSAEAINILQRAPINIILLDINLPGENGIELLKIVKENYPAIKVIMCTNKASAYYKTLCKKIGADFFVDKSREFDQLHSIISSIL